MRKYNDTTTKIHRDSNKIITEYSQDVSGCLKQVEELRKTADMKANVRHAARIPQTLLMKWAQEDANDPLAYLQGKHNRDPELARKLAVRLNSNEFQAFRIWDGDLSHTDLCKESNKLYTGD